jgi:uncharacterized protein YndB with AHSA1/START domain
VAENRILVQAPPERVFDVLSDPDRYCEWVVGAAETEGGQSARPWPRPGSRFRHRVGFGPFSIRDSTKVEEAERPRRLVLEARFRPLGVATVEMLLEPRGDDTLVVMREHPRRGPMKLVATVARPVVDLMVSARNAESLRRLKRIVEEKKQPA